MKKKLVKETINENIKVEGHEFSVLPYHSHHIYVGKDGLLASHNVFISWEDIEKLLQKFSH